MSVQPAGTIDVGAVFERVLRTYSEHWRVLITGALILFAPIAVLGGIVATSGSAGLAILLTGFVVLGSIWYQGMVVETVRDVQDGTLDSSVGQLFASVTPVLTTLLAAGLLAVIGIVIGFLLLIVPGLYLLTIWAVLAPAIVIERVGVGAAFTRSRELVRGNGWQVFGVIVAVFALQFMLSIVLSAIGAVGDSVVWNVLLQLVQSLIVAPIWALAASILYFALREAHGDSGLAQATGVLKGGFIPPVAPDVAPEPPPAAPAAPAAPAEFEPPAGAGTPTEPAAFEAPAAPAEPEPPAAFEEQPAPAEPEPPAAFEEPAAPAEPEPEAPVEDLEAAESAFGTPDAEPETDAFGQAASGGDAQDAAPEPDPPTSQPREPGQSIPPPGWTPPGQ